MPTRSPIGSVNDFVVRFANVNGSGSASANELFARSVLRMGVPVSSRNIFPSNIQGLPTWYEVRLSEAGHLGARGGIDLMVAMNPQTWDKDVASIEPGGYLFYDSTKPMPASKFRDDITVLGVPLTAICNREYTDPRQRQLFKNIIYLGALSTLLGIESDVIVRLFSEQFKGKEKLIGANVHALHLGRDWVTMNMDSPCGLKVRRSDKVGDRIYIDGNAAAALGAVYGGATVCAWYPLTPSSSLADAFTSYCAKLRTGPDDKRKYAIIQGEDEIASIDDPQRIPVLPRNHVADDRTEIGFSDPVSIRKRTTFARGHRKRSLAPALVAQTGTVPRARINNYAKRQQRSGGMHATVVLALSGPPARPTHCG
jgi:2-oxoglutarate/2-oxoacid ferredoxin oxidoreductase subunit alpha